MKPYPNGTKSSFDSEEMEQGIITKKIENLLGVMNWDPAKAEDKTTFDSLFDWN